MRTCSIIGAGLLSLIAVPALAFAILFYGFAQIVLGSPEFVAKLEPANLEAQMRKAAPYMVASALNNPNDPDSQTLLDELLPDPGTRAMATELMPLLLEGSQGNPSADLLAKLDTQVATMYDQAPACSPDDDAAYAQAIAGAGELPSVFCRPSDPTVQQQAIAMTTSSIRQMFADLNQMPLPNTDGTSTNRSPEVMGQGIAETIAATRANAGQGFVVPLTLMVLVLVLAVRSVRALLAWSGGILLFAGLIGLGMAFTSGSILAVDWKTTLTQEIQGPELNIALIFVELFTADAFSALVSWLSQTNTILVGVGAVAMLLSAFIKSPAQPARATATANPAASAIPSMSGGTSMQDPGATQPIPTNENSDSKK